MTKQRISRRVFKNHLRGRAAACGACVCAAALAIGIALTAMSAVLLLLGALGVESAPGTVTSAGQDAVVALYAVQLVGLSFFNDTAELRFAAVPGLLLVGLSLAAVAAVVARTTTGSTRRRLRLAVAISIPYALLVAFAALFVPLHFTAPGFAVGIAVSPSAAEAFLLPFGWGLLFASVGGLVGAYGRGWRREATHLLGAWATPLASVSRALAAALAVSAAVALIGALGASGWDLGSVVGSDFGQALKVAAVAVLTLPTLAAAVLVSGFGVPFEWQVDALSHGEGSLSAFGGSLPSASSSSQAAPDVLALAPLIALAAVFAVGWLSARRSGPNARLGLRNAVRAALLTTLAVWLLALLARVDARAGGLLGFHLVPDAGALLWRVPLIASVGSFAGSFAYALMQGPAARRQLAATLRAVANPSSWGQGSTGMSRPEWVSNGLTWRAALGVGFAAVPVLLVGMGATGPVSSASPEKVSLAPIRQAAEQQLERASTDDESVAVTVNPETRVVGTASVDTPLRALDIAPGKSRATKAEDVLVRYGELFGLSHPAAELGNPRSFTDEFGVTHVSFVQVADGLPVFGGGISVHLSNKGERLDFVSGSLVPDVMLGEEEVKVSARQATKEASKALPSGSLGGPPNLQVYAGREPYISGPHARLAWFVWLVSEEKHASEEYVVDAVTGEILDTIPKTHLAKSRKIYDWSGGPELPGELARKESDPATKDVDVDNAYDHTGTSYDYYAGLELEGPLGSTQVSTVHFDQASGAAFENAYWNGAQLVFGDEYSTALDIVGHEVTHAVTERTSELIASGQSGALSESISDIQGMTIEMKKEEEVDWEIGEDLPNGPLRSLSEPSKYSEPVGTTGSTVSYPEHLSEWIVTCLDNWGIHINSSITSHAFYLATIKMTENKALEMELQEAAEVASQLFLRGVTSYLTDVPSPTLEHAREATLEAIKSSYGEESPVYVSVEEAFAEVGLNGVAQPSLPNCGAHGICSFAQALETRKSVSGEEAAEMLATLYKARGELALTTRAGDHFLPLYESNMVRITELVGQDPVLAEMTISGLEEITPALNALVEGDGEDYQLSAEQMEKIEAALRRLAQDDRVYEGEGAGELADLIDEELQWMGLPSYAGMDYEAGFSRLNSEVKSQSLMEETGVITDPNCTGDPYPNNFHINKFYAETLGYDIPGQVSPFKAGGIICGTEVEVKPGKKEGCVGEESLNTEVSVQLPPGDKVNSTKNLSAGSWVGELRGYGIACAGDETQLVYGQAGLLSLQSWKSTQCPETAIACYKGKSTFGEGFESVTGEGYAWISEEGGALKLTTRPVSVTTVNGYQIRVGFGQFEVKLCGRAGSAEAQACGGPTATWIHQNGETAEPGCPSTKGRYYMRAKNAAGESTIPVSACVRWEEEAHMQTIDAPNSLNAVSCVPSSTICITANSKGNALYSTNVSATSTSTWNSWTGPGESPAHDIACPTSTLCVLSTGAVSGGGGNVYRASSLGGSFLSSFKPTNGVGALSCPSSSFCVSAQEGGGFIRYSTKPSGILWTAVTIGTGAMKDVACLSSSFCAVVDAAGNVRVATSEAKIKEAGGWTASSVNGGIALRAVACSSTTSCIAVDGSEEVLKLTISLPGGSATASSQALPGASEINDVTCTGETCVAVDYEGGIFTSSNSGTTWARRFDAKGDLTSVSCASASLCAAVSSAGDVVKFDPV